MRVTNNTKEAIIACTWHTSYGPGDDTQIEPGETKEPIGPFIGEMGGGDCHLDLPGEIVCHQKEDDDNNFQVIKGLQLELSADGIQGVTIRHFSEDLEHIYWPFEEKADRIVN